MPTAVSDGDVASAAPSPTAGAMAVSATLGAGGHDGRHSTSLLSLALPHLSRAAPEELSETLVWAPRPGSRATCILGRRIGIGGFAEVFEAELSHPRAPTSGAPAPRDGAPAAPPRRVALKRLLPGLRGDPLRQRQLRREAQIGALLNHPNIVRVLSLIEFGGELGEEVALAMELVDGMQCNHLLHRLAQRRLRLRLPIVAEIATGLFAALQYLENPRGAGQPPTAGPPHRGERPIVHADISLENLMLTKDGEVKLIDFGIAAEDLSAASSEPLDDEALTSLHQVAGKRPYLPPEGMAPGGPSSGSDLYAAGVCFWEMCTGCRFPILPRGVSDREIGSLIAFAAKDLPEPVWLLLKSCLAVSPDERMSSARTGWALSRSLRGRNPHQHALAALIRALSAPQPGIASPAAAAHSVPAWSPIDADLSTAIVAQDHLTTLSERLRFAFCAERVLAFVPVDTSGSTADGLWDDDGGPQAHFALCAASYGPFLPDGGSQPRDVSALHAIESHGDVPLPTMDRLREALNVGVLEQEDGSLLFRVRPPGDVAHVVCVFPAAGTAYDPMAQAILRNLLCPIPS